MYFSVVKDKPLKFGIQRARLLGRKTWVPEDMWNRLHMIIHTLACTHALLRVWSDVSSMFSDTCTFDLILNLLLAATSEATGEGQGEEQEEETEGETKQEEETSEEEEEETRQ